MDWQSIFGIVDGMARLALVGLVLVAIGSIVIFFRVFQSDFNNPD